MARRPPGTAARVEGIGPGYEDGRPPAWHSPPDPIVAALAGAVTAGVWLQPPWLAPVVIGGALAVIAMIGQRPRAAVLAIVVALAVGAGAIRSDQAWTAVAPRELGPYAGWAHVVGDQLRAGSGRRVTLEIEGQRFDAWVYGSSARRLALVEAGQWVQVAGVRRSHTDHPRRAQVRHVVGRFDTEFVADVADGSRLDEASRRVRAALRRSAEATMTGDDAALFTGMVIGDDTRQQPALVDAFRTAGLSHLTAVSGQNLAFVIALAGPLLRRLRPWARWAASVGAVGWFVALTRFEPSVVRAGTMAALSATVFVLGGRASAARLLYLAVGVLALVDPLLVWSVGFWLSVGATWGVVVVAGRVTAVLPGPRWLAAPLGVTVGAQLGVALPGLLVFGRLPIVAIPANLLAVPVAGFVMLYGIPAAALGDLVPPLRPLLMAPAELATRWVRTVALLAAEGDLPSTIDVAGWAAFAVFLAVCSWRRAGAGVPG